MKVRVVPFDAQTALLWHCCWEQGLYELPTTSETVGNRPYGIATTNILEDLTQGAIIC
jgi:hypothetical protein